MSRALAAAVLGATVLGLIAAPGALGAVEPFGGSGSAGGPAVSPTRLIVEWAAGSDPADRRGARAAADVELSRTLGRRRFQLVEVEPGQRPRAALRALRADPAVALAAREVYYAPDAVPNDPLFGYLWGLRNEGTGIGGFAGALAGADIGAVAAWDRTVGTPETVVAVIDSGYRFEHPDLAGVAWTNPDEIDDGVDNDGNGIVDDLRGADFVGVDADEPARDGDPSDDNLASGGHGVHVAGTIGAQGDNGVGIVGVAQDVSLMPLRVCSRRGESDDRGCPSSALVEAVNYAGAKGARVANMSLGGEGDDPALRAAFAANPQTLFVVSAGNEASDNDAGPRAPCTIDPRDGGASTVDNVVCVAATDQADRLAGFSNWGRTTVDLGAPGTETLSAYPLRWPIDDDFEVDDFADRWSAVGPDGGFVRASGPPFDSFGMAAAATAGSVRTSTTSIALPPGYDSCTLGLSYWHSGGELWRRAYLDGDDLFGISGGHSRRWSYDFRDALGGGGEFTLELSYEAAGAPGPDDGAWIDDVELRCLAQVGEADGYAFLQGTSMASPHVAGVAALLFSLRPAATVAEVRRGLLDSAERISALAGRTVSGGRVDAAAATDLFDAVPPPAPTLAGTVPSSPAADDRPRLRGSAQRGTAIEVHAGTDCSGPVVASGTAAELAGAGIAVAVAPDAVSHFSLRATDLVPLASACSAPVAYTHATPPDPDDEPSGPGTDLPGSGDPPLPPPTADPPRPPFPAAPPDGIPTRPASRPAVCVVPRLRGRTLSRARTMLRRAGCTLGKVRRPSLAQRKRAQRLRRPLVVRSFTPNAGRRLTRGKVRVTLGPKPKPKPKRKRSRAHRR